MRGSWEKEGMLAYRSTPHFDRPVRWRREAIALQLAEDLCRRRALDAAVARERGDAVPHATPCGVSSEAASGGRRSVRLSAAQVKMRLSAAKVNLRRPKYRYALKNSRSLK